MLIACVMRYARTQTSIGHYCSFLYSGRSDNTFEGSSEKTVYPTCLIRLPFHMIQTLIKVVQGPISFVSCHAWCEWCLSRTGRILYIILNFPAWRLGPILKLIFMTVKAKIRNGYLVLSLLLRHWKLSTTARQRTRKLRKM